MQFFSNNINDSRRTEEEPLCNNGNENIIQRIQHNHNGLSTLTAAVFIIGEMAGSGVLALPKAIVRTGWIGMILIVIFCINAAVGGTCLGHCWEILEERFPEHQVRTRNPYATVAYRAIGKYGSYLVTACIQFTLFGTGTVYLLLSSQIIQELFTKIFPAINFCYWFLLISVVLAPFMWLGSPKDFWIVGMGATLTTIFACILIFIQLLIDGNENEKPVLHRVHSFHEFFIAFGTLLFAFGGASTFPTIQNDMKNKQNFSKSILIAFSVILALYLPVAYGGYFVYGDKVDSNIVLTLPHSYLVIAAEILLAIHLVLAFLIVINPVCQELEEFFKVSPDFNKKRCIIRSLMVMIMVCVGTVIPSFSKILSLVGGSTITLLTFVFPPLFYMKLCKQKDEMWPERIIPGYIKVYLWELIAIGLVGGCASTYSAVLNIFESDTSTKSCF